MRRMGLLSLVMFGSVTFAQTNFTEADERFAQRGNQNFEELKQTRARYADLYKAATADSDRVYAVTQMSRLDLYRGAMIEGVDVRDKKRVFDECLQTVELIKDTQSVPYHLFKISCIAYRGKLEGLLGRLEYGLKMRAAQGAALQAAQGPQGDFEGGGILRVLSAVRGNRKAKPLGLYDAAEGVNFATRALEAAPSVNAPFPEMSGKDYFDNVYYLAQAQVALGIENSDLSLVQEAQGRLNTQLRLIANLERRGRLGARAPELLYYKKMMQTLKGHADLCVQANKSDWANCLVEKMDE